MMQSFDLGFGAGQIARMLDRQSGGYALAGTRLPPARTSTIPSPIPKNPVGSYQLSTDCIGESTCAFVERSRAQGI
jgi:hypothetical protein